MKQRKHPRIQANGIASHLKSRDSVALGMPVENISVGGVFVQSPEPLPMGAPVLLELVRPGMKDSLRVTGRVVGRLEPKEAKKKKRSPGIAVRFDPMSDEDTKRLHQLLETLATELGGNPTKVTQAVEDSRYTEFDYAFETLVDEIIDSEPVSGEQEVPVAVVPEGTQLVAQVSGLLTEVSAAHSKMFAYEAELTALRTEVTTLRRENLRLTTRLAILEKSKKSKP